LNPNVSPEESDPATAPTLTLTPTAPPASGAAGRRGPLRRFTIDTRPLRHAPYRRLWNSTVVTSVGSQLTAIAVPYQIYQLTHSSTWVGLASFAGLAPLIVFGLWGGAVADTVDRRKLLLVTNSGVALTSFGLWLQGVVGVHSVALLIGLLMVQQAMFGLNSPARGAAIPRLVPASELPAANALNATVMNVGAVAGPMLAGSLIPLIGLSTLYLIDTLGLSAALWAVVLLPAMPPIEGAARRATWGHVTEGFRFVMANRLLFMSFAVDLVAMVFGMPRALFPQLASTTFASNHFSLGLLYAAIPVGAMLGGLLSGTFTRARRHGLMTIFAVLAWGVAIIGFGLTGSLWVAVFFLAVAGAADLVSMVFRGSILQSAVPDDLRGRMQGVFTVVVAGGPRLADLLHGVIGGAVGSRTTIAGGGVAVIIGTILLALFVPSYRHYRAPVDGTTGEKSGAVDASDSVGGDAAATAKAAV
jgi:MFS family permease